MIPPRAYPHLRLTEVLLRYMCEKASAWSRCLALGAGISPLNFRFKVALVNCWHAFRRCRLVQSVRSRSGLILQRSLSPVKFRAQSPLWNHDMRFVCVCVWVCVCVRVCVCILYSDSAGSHKLRAWVLGRGTFPVHFSYNVNLMTGSMCIPAAQAHTKQAARSRARSSSSTSSSSISSSSASSLDTTSTATSSPSSSSSSSISSFSSSSPQDHHSQHHHHHHQHHQHHHHHHHPHPQHPQQYPTLSPLSPNTDLGLVPGIMVIVQPGRVYDCHMASNHHGVY